MRLKRFKACVQTKLSSSSVSIPMLPKHIALVMPLFLGALALEFLLVRRRNPSAIRFVDAITNLGCGFGTEALRLVFQGGLTGFYAVVSDHWAVLHLAPDSPWTWLVAFVGLDFFYYWGHRFSHETNLLWASHVVHHQSEDFNLAVALRQSYLASVAIFPFYLPLALLGIPTSVYVVCLALNLLYQLWIHTELIERLPRPLEWLLNTPSHHRVHHGVNLEYLDKNYGGILIIWDRLFGTFEPERAPVAYGITKPIASFNPLWANLQYCVEIASLGRRAQLPLGLVRAAFAAPGWNPETGQVDKPAGITRAEFTRSAAPATSRGLQAWIIVQLILMVAGLTVLLLFFAQLPPLTRRLGAALIILSTIAWAGLLERKCWGWPLELARLAASITFVVWLAIGAC